VCEMNSMFSTSFVCGCQRSRLRSSQALLPFQLGPVLAALDLLERP
jgi:hypothetical protein